MRRRPELTEDEYEALVDHWENRLAAEGLPAAPPRRLRRGPKGKDGKRPWLGSWEYPSSVGQGHTETQPDVSTFRSKYRDSGERPWNEHEAMMVKPDQPIEISRQQLLILRDLLYDTAETVLTVQEQLVVRAHVISGLTLTETGEILGLAKSTVHGMKTRALAELHRNLSPHPTIIEYLQRHDVPDE